MSKIVAIWNDNNRTPSVAKQGTTFLTIPDCFVGGLLAMTLLFSSIKQHISLNECKYSKFIFIFKNPASECDFGFANCKLQTEN
jgi:hypothetical protein